MASEIGSPHLGQGFTLFSPSFMTHVLAQAQGIEQCGDAAHSPKAADEPPPGSFSHCIDEFPRSAVMVKTSWSPIEDGATANIAHNTHAGAMRVQLADLGGRWPTGAAAQLNTDKMYSVEADDGKTYGLNAIHFSTKDTREWIWVTLWWDPKPDSDFGADRPTSLSSYNQGVWANYKMCVTSGFKEADPAPWLAFQQKSPTLAASLKASHDVMASQNQAPPFDEVTTWCSNPNVERHPNNDKTNCIGCHQYSLTQAEIPAVVGFRPIVSPGETQFSDTIWLMRRTRSSDLSLQVPDANLASYRQYYPQLGRSRIRANFPADFAWSTSMEFQSQIAEARDGKFGQLYT